MHTSVIGNREPADGVEIEIGPALQTDVGCTQLNANVFLERRFDGAAPRPP